MTGCAIIDGHFSSARVTDTVHLFAEGDSIAASGPVEAPHLPTEPYSYARLLPAEYSPQPGLTVAAYPGTNMTQMAARLLPGSGLTNETFDVLALITAQVALGKTVIISTHMGNGLIEKSPADMHTAMKAYWASCRNAGAYIIACALLPRHNETFAPGWNTTTDRADYNRLQLSDPSEFDEQCFHHEWFNEQAASTPTSPPTAGNAVYEDGIHLTATGYQYLLIAYKQAYERILSVYRPRNTSAPTISGGTDSGNTLTANQGTWTQADSYVYQWFRKTGTTVTPIAGANSSTYTLTSADVGSTVKVNEGARRFHITAWKASAYTSAISNSFGPNLVTNGTFTTDTTGWTVTNATFGVSGGVGVLTGTGAFHGRFEQDITTESGASYRIEWDFALGINSPPGRMIAQYGIGGTVVANEDCTTTGSYSANFVAVGTTLTLGFRDPSDSGPAAAGSTWLWDNITLRKIL